jgi:hypothetical protein
VADSLTTATPGQCRYCGTELQSAQATSCVRCYGARLKSCPQCCDDKGRLKKRRKGSGYQNCPRCKNKRTLFIEP